MRKKLHTFVRKATAALLLTSASTLSMLAAEPESPQSIIHPEWEYTYYNNFGNLHVKHDPIYQICRFTKQKEIDGKNYWLFKLQVETKAYGGTPKDVNAPLAYIREENGKVYMRLPPEAPFDSYYFYYTYSNIYGHEDREIMIYDFNLKAGEGYQIGDPDLYPVYDAEDVAKNYDGFVGFWVREQVRWLPYSYLMVWDDGRLSVADVKEDEQWGRRVWFMHQKCSYPEAIYWPGTENGLDYGMIDELDTDFESTHTRTFRFLEGIGCLRSFLPFPGLYIPRNEDYSAGYYSEVNSPYLCMVYDKVTGKTIYEDKHRPGYTSVDEIGADSESAAPEYYTLQGIRTLNPAPGEICIVRRGAKVTKEAIGER